MSNLDQAIQVVEPVHHQILRLLALIASPSMRASRKLSAGPVSRSIAGVFSVLRENAGKLPHRLPIESGT